jgi:glycine oxidase
VPRRRAGERDVVVVIVIVIVIVIVEVGAGVVVRGAGLRRAGDADVVLPLLWLHASLTVHARLRYDAAMQQTPTGGDVVVVGGGVIGCSVAYELAARHSARVVVLERAVPGAEASSAAAGILGAQLEAHAGEEVASSSLFSLLLASRARHAELDARLREDVGFGTGYRACGALRVTSDESAFDALVRAHAWQRTQGATLEVVDASAVHALEPALDRSMRGGVHFPHESQVDPPSMLRALQQACAARGVVFRSGILVRGVSTSPLGVQTSEGMVRGEAVIIAAGSWSSLVDGLPAGVRNVRPVRGQIVQVDTRPPIARRVVVGDGGYVVTRADGRTLLGSTMEEAGHVKEVTAGGVHDVLSAALRLFPALRTAPISATWSGFRPATPDDRPMLGETSIARLFVATGHHRNGILLAPETARLLADLVATGACDRDLTPFSPRDRT